MSYLTFNLILADSELSEPDNQGSYKQIKGIHYTNLISPCQICSRKLPLKASRLKIALGFLLCANIVRTKALPATGIWYIWVAVQWEALAW